MTVKIGLVWEISRNNGETGVSSQALVVSPLLMLKRLCPVSGQVEEGALASRYALEHLHVWMRNTIRSQLIYHIRLTLAADISSRM